MESPPKSPRIPVFYNKESRQSQNFSIPEPLVFYIANNVNSIKAYKNLIKSCKYFYAINEVHFLSCLFFKAYEHNRWLTCSVQDSRHVCDPDEFNENSSKIWLTNSLRLYAKNETTPKTLISEIIPKLYRCSISRLILSSQQLSFDEFLFLTAEVKHFYFHYVTVSYSNQKPVELETMVEKLPKLEILKFKFFPADPCVTGNSAKNLLELGHFKNLKQLSFYNIPQQFNFNEFYPFFFENENIKFDVTFREPIADDYKFSIEAYENGAEYQPHDM